MTTGMRRGAVVYLVVVVSAACGGSKPAATPPLSPEIRGAPIGGPVSEASKETLPAIQTVLDSKPVTLPAAGALTAQPSSGPASGPDPLAPSASIPISLSPAPRLAEAPPLLPAGAATPAGYSRMPFEKLAGFDYVFGDSLPPEIQAFNGKSVRIQGFMTPLEMEGLHVRRFLLTADQAMCCFGVIPPINGWIVVRMKGNGTAPYTNDLMVAVEGRLIVGEKYEDGALSFVYEIIADRVTKIEA